VQTEGNEYIKIHAQQQRLVATTTPPTTTSTTTTTAAPVEEDLDYGFIRPPNFRPVNAVHPVDNRFQAPITYRPPLSEVRLARSIFRYIIALISSLSEFYLGIEAEESIIRKKYA